MRFDANFDLEGESNALNYGLNKPFVPPLF